MKIETNKISDYTTGGISLRELSQAKPTGHALGLHRDDYFAFCLLTQGELHINIDFKEYVLHSGEVGCMLPGQIHQYANIENAKGFLMMIDGVLLGDSNLHFMQHFIFPDHPLPIYPEKTAELLALFPMLQNRLQTPKAKDFARAIVDVFVEIFSQHDDTNNLNPRQREIFFKFKQLLDSHITANRQPSFYADKLHITTGYLNEILTEATGFSTSQMIQGEIVLRMKREVAYSTDSIQEVSRKLGFEDYAYFSRLFTKVVGITPTLFRSKYHD